MTAIQDSVAEAEADSAQEARPGRGFLHPGMARPFCLLVSCFAAWGLAGNMTDPW